MATLFRTCFVRLVPPVAPDDIQNVTMPTAKTSVQDALPMRQDKFDHVDCKSFVVVYVTKSVQISNFLPNKITVIMCNKNSNLEISKFDTMCESVSG